MSSPAGKIWRAVRVFYSGLKRPDSDHERRPKSVCVPFIAARDDQCELSYAEPDRPVRIHRTTVRLSCWVVMAACSRPFRSRCGPGPYPHTLESCPLVRFSPAACARDAVWRSVALGLRLISWGLLPSGGHGHVVLELSVRACMARNASEPVVASLQQVGSGQPLHAGET
jgi:hypothetical protein